MLASPLLEELWVFLGWSSEVGRVEAWWFPLCGMNRSGICVYSRVLWHSGVANQILLELGS